MPINPGSSTAPREVQLAVGACVLAALDPQPARICVGAAGIVGWNNCCPSVEGGPGGQLVVSWQRDFYSDDGRAEVSFVGDDNLCSPELLGTEFVVNVMRCSPAVDQDGTAPDCAVVDAVGAQVMLDRYAVRNSLACCLNGLLESGEIMGFQILPTTSAGAGGGCIGSDTVVRIYLPLCVTC
jgi:hypothetical protein